MWIARIGRPGEIYNASAAVQTFSECKWSIRWPKMGNFWKWENGDFQKARMIFDHMPVFSNFLQGEPSDVNKVNILKKTRNRAHLKQILRRLIFIFWKGDPEIKGDVNIK